MEKAEHKLPFELIVGDETGEIMNGDIPVRWCVTPELVKELEDNDIIDPHILLVSATEDGREMQRQMVPITELMTYVRFTRSGNMKLYGFILNGVKGRKKIHSTYMQRVSGDYFTDILFSYTGKPHDSLPYAYTRTDVTVNIPTGVFGEEPGPWMKWFVNLWHTNSSKVVDECHYRRRLMIAFSLKWLPVLIWTMMLITFRVTVTGLLALSGYYKGMKFMRSFRPYKWGSIDMHILDEVDVKKNAFLFTREYVHKRSGDYTETITMFSTLAFFPSILLVQAFIISLTTTYFIQTMLVVTGIIFVAGVIWDLGNATFKWLENTELFTKVDTAGSNVMKSIVDFFDTNNRWRYFKWIGYGLATAIVITFSTMFITVGLFLVPILVTFILMMVYGDKIIEWLNNIYTVAPENNDYTEIRELLCPKDELNLIPDIHLIPPKQRTVRLWYLDLKNKVCKPMQQ